jgi:hypothetical protein
MQVTPWGLQPLDNWEILLGVEGAPVTRLTCFFVKEMPVVFDAAVCLKSSGNVMVTSYFVFFFLSAGYLLGR